LKNYIVIFLWRSRRSRFTF